MKVKARTLVIVGLLTGGMIFLLAEMFIAKRLFSTRDLQLGLVVSLEQEIALERLLLSTIIDADAGEAVPAALLGQLSTVQIPLDCCEAVRAALLASIVSDSGPGAVAYTNSRTAEYASALLASVSRHVAAQKSELNTLYTENRVIPFLLTGVLLLALCALWLGYRFAVIRPIERLTTAVESRRADGRFSFSDQEFAPEEIRSLAAAFESLVRELARALEAKSEELDEYLSAARAAAERTASELAELVDSSSAPIFTLNRSGEIQAWNRKVAKMTKYPAATVVGQSFESAFLDSTHRLTFLSAFELALAGQPQEALRLPLTASGVKPIELLLSMSPQTDISGAIVGVMCVGQGVGAFLESTHRALEMQRTRHFSELAAGAAHQLNQPLQKMRLLLANANNRLRLPEIDREVVAAKVKGADEQLSRLAEIVDHLRVFGQQVKPVPGGFDLGIIVARCVDLARGGFNERGMRLVLHNQLQDQKVEGHPLQIERTLMGLLDNAREALLETAPDFPQVDVSAHVDAHAKVTIVVEDNGGGIDEATMPKVFDPFFTTKINAKNTGLGLAAAATLVGEMGGEMALVNANNGVRVSVILPVITSRGEG